jgi:hypothetical protein
MDQLDIFYPAPALKTGTSKKMRLTIKKTEHGAQFWNLAKRAPTQKAFLL